MKTSRFQQRTITPGQAARISRVRKAFEELELAIEGSSMGPSRELSLCLTNLEQAAMWAIRAISTEGDREEKA